jgi:hypothetical protein
MGGGNSKRKNTNESLLILQLLSDMKWQDRLWRVFCFKFEYKFFKNVDSDHPKYMVNWDEIVSILFNSWDEDEQEKDYTKYIIFHTMKKYFLHHNNEVRLFRIYMLFFPYTLQLSEVKSLNFIDLFFEKIIYNLELEMKAASNVVQLTEVEAEETIVSKEEASKGDILNSSSNDDLSIIENSKNQDITNRKLIGGNDESKFPVSKFELPLNKHHDMKDIDSVKEKTNLQANFIENNLLSAFNEYFEKKKEGAISNLSYVRQISYSVFREIMFVYFENNVTLIVKAMKDVIKEFDEYRYENDKMIKQIKRINYRNINTDKLTNKNVYSYIDQCIDKLIKVRVKLSTIKEKETIILTLEDVLVFIQLNPMFLNTIELFEDFDRKVD